MSGTKFAQGARREQSTQRGGSWRGAAAGLLLSAAGVLLGGATCEVTDIGWPSEHWPGGIGAVLGYSSAEHRLVVREVPPDSPAARARLLVEDEVLEIDGREVSGMELTEVVEALRGEVGSTVTLRLRRGEEELELEVERGPYQGD